MASTIFWATYVNVVCMWLEKLSISIIILNGSVYIVQCNAVVSGLSKENFSTIRS